MQRSKSFFMVMRNRFRLIFFISILSMSYGCTTMAIWSSASYYNYESSATATGLEIYGEDPSHLNKYDHPEVRISYTAAQKMTANTPIPAFLKGCIDLKRFNNSARFLVGLESLLNAVPKSNITSVKAVFSREFSKSGHDSAERFDFRFELALKPVNNDLFNEGEQPRVDSIWIPFLHGKTPQSSVGKSRDRFIHRLYRPLDSTVIPENSEKDLLYLLVSGPSAGVPSNKTQLAFDKECPSDESFVPLLRDEKIPFTIEFVEGKRAMKFPLAARIAMTPFAVAFDVVTFPLQLIGFLYWHQFGEV